MGAVDLVIQVEAPPSVAAGLQRVGRAGHQVGAVSRGVVFPKHRGDLVSCAVVAGRMATGGIEELRYPRNPLDVLAQQIVAMVAMEPWHVDRSGRAGAPGRALRRAAGLGPRCRARHALRPLSVHRVRRAAAAAGLGSGRRPAHRPPRRAAARRDQRRHDPRPGPVRRVPGRVRRRPPGSASSTRRWSTSPASATCSCSARRPGGSRTSRPTGCSSRRRRERPRGCRSGRATRSAGRSSWAAPSAPGCASSRRHPAIAARASLTEAGLDTWAIDNLLAYLAEQRDATRVLPDDRTVLVERFRDELGDWRMTVHCVLGARVNGPWALAIGRRLAERYGVDAQVMPSDDGIVVRLPDTVDEPPGADLVAFDPDEIATIVEESVGTSAMFASRFRECAARALLLPRRDPRRRTPLWQQRQRSAQLLDVARDFADFPITLEAARECLRDVFDVPGLVELMRDIAGRRIRRGRGRDAEAVAVRPVAAVRICRRVPLRGRRAAGRAPGRRARARLDPARRAARPGRPARAARPGGGGRDRAPAAAARRATIRRATPRTPPRCCGCSATCPRPRRSRAASTRAWLAELVGCPPGDRGADRRRAAMPADRRRRPGPRRARGRAAGRRRRCAYLEPVADPLGDLVARYARTHGPVRGRHLRGPVRPRRVRRRAGAAPAGRGRPDRVRRIHARRCRLRVLRRRGAAAAAPTIARGAAQGDRTGRAGGPGPVPAVAGSRSARRPAASRPWPARSRCCGGVAVPASALERLVLPARVADYAPAFLDELCASGEVVWAGAGSLGSARRMGHAGLRRRGTAAAATARPGPRRRPAARRDPRPPSTAARRCSSGPSPDPDCRDDRATPMSPRAIWDLVWAGYLSNDTIGPLRTLLAGGAGTHKAKATPGRTRYRRPGRPGSRSRRAPGVAAPDRHDRPVVPPARPRPRSDPPRRRDRRRAPRPARRRDPWRGHGRGHRRWLRRCLSGASPRWRNAARPAGATSSKGLARHSSRCPVPSTGCER